MSETFQNENFLLIRKFIQKYHRLHGDFNFFCSEKHEILFIT